MPWERNVSPFLETKLFGKSKYMVQFPLVNMAGVGRARRFTLAAKPHLAPELEIAYLQTSEFIFVAKFDFPSDLSPSLP